jgi:exodeoxyribonuclease V alpha subunit
MSVLDQLEDLRKKEVISAVEVEFVRFLATVHSSVKGEVLWAASACIHAQRNGHICLDFNKWDDKWLFGDKKSNIKITDSLKTEWLSGLKESPIVSNGNELQPLVLESERLYLHRFWSFEEELCHWLNQKSSPTHDVSDQAKKIMQSLLAPSGDLFETNWQHVAVQLSFLKDLVIISGGPGTGKTFTVLNIIAAHVLAHSTEGEEYRIALAAPTGKAARRLDESIEAGKANLPEHIQAEFNLTGSAQTVHKLLGSDFRGSSFSFNEENLLPYDLVVIDEASMLDIHMWVHLIRAIGANTKLVILGDKDQLASVEAGSILGDICRGDNLFSRTIADSLSRIQNVSVPIADDKPTLNDCILFLKKSYRFGEHSGIQKFAAAVNDSNPDLAIEILQDSSYKDLGWMKPSSENMESVIKEYAVNHHAEFSVIREEKRLPASNQKRILCALRRGPFGVEQINSTAEKLIKRNLGLLAGKIWFEGRIVMATRNDSIIRVKNGDIGLYSDSKESIQFEGKEGQMISANRLKDYEPAFAITIHKSQGSEFNDVAIILSNQVNSVLSKEILYTAVTRARENTLIIVSEEVLRKTIERSVSRTSGLRHKIWGS